LYVVHYLVELCLTGRANVAGPSQPESGRCDVESGSCLSFLCSAQLVIATSRSCGRTRTASSAEDGAWAPTETAALCWPCSPPPSTRRLPPSIASRPALRLLRPYRSRGISGCGTAGVTVFSFDRGRAGHCALIADSATTLRGWRNRCAR
jgi:hypothetical protein